ncbi:carboxy terminal-processing peptidase [Polaribacter sargassicola]|uniref:carboxy terminal-processing peptidase n=1 Tax=Polaribacter sargassicola TaxID=2836891 RepID=UPI001F2A2C5E|nr:carboxy terminal-processing peptidase [Polaribacter sp. DS7-9]MCG1036000.1 carboxy terminal-processing peptidase [Polaribacter sp. DS7-9]
MKTKYQITTFLIALTLLFNSLQLKATNTIIEPDSDKDKLIIYILRNILTRSHYVVKDINDDFSEYVYNEFINGLDPNKRYFTQDDLKEFSKYKYKIDDQLLNEDISFYNLVYSRFQSKIKNAKSYYGGLLAQSFNFRKNENIDVDYEKMPFAKNENELIDYWRKQLKLSTLARIQSKTEKQNAALEKDPKTKVKSFKELEKESRLEVLKSMDELYYRIEELENDDWFSTFLNSVVGAFDPHSTYMPANIKERFDQDMSGKLEGIGARLVQKGVFTHVYELVSGGPAWKQGELEPEDIILEVAQGNEEPLDIVGMRLDDAIKFIKGKKGTEVRLTVKKKLDGSTKVISIIRDVVELEETFVKSSIVEKDGKKFGVIDLPKFYISFDDENYRDSAKDMEQEIERLKGEGVTGLIIDLRNNGGGSLKTAIEISGLFIDKGPIVQVKYRDQDPIIKEDVDPKVQWDGSVVLLVNEFSASASEIFAAAMQDYGRAVVMGGNQTYGKGTVQSVLPINQFTKFDEDLGAIKMTIQKFYRINGGTTQIEGVYSDIAMPNKYSYMKFGERDLEGALPWDKVKRANYNQTNSYQNFADVISNSKKRIAENKKFNLINEYAKWLKENQDDTVFSLNYKSFAEEKSNQEKEVEKFDTVFDYTSNLTFTSPTYELPSLKEDPVLADKRVAWHKSLSQDIYISEALNVLSELKMNNTYNAIVKH